MSRTKEEHAQKKQRRPRAAADYLLAPSLSAR
jgi:hypothetical protein